MRLPILYLLILAPAGCGQSVAGPVVLASDLASPQAIALDSHYVYWTTSDGLVSKVARAGGEPITLASGQSFPGDIAVDRDRVYWTTSDGVMAEPVAGGTPVELVAARSPTGLAVDATTLYWLEDGSVRAADLSGANARTLASDQNGPWRLAVSQGTIFWTDLGSLLRGDGTVMEMPATGGPASSVASAPLAYAIAADPGLLCWTEVSAGAPYGSVWTVALGAGGTPTAVSQTEAGPGAIAMDDAGVYWVDEGSLPSNGTVEMVPRAGGAPVTVAGDQSQPDDIAVDGGEIYWLNHGSWTGAADGSVMTMHRPL